MRCFLCPVVNDDNNDEQEDNAQTSEERDHQCGSHLPLSQSQFQHQRKQAERGPDQAPACIDALSDGINHAREEEDQEQREQQTE